MKQAIGAERPEKRAFFCFQRMEGPLRETTLAISFPRKKELIPKLA